MHCFGTKTAALGHGRPRALTQQQLQQMKYKPPSSTHPQLTPIPPPNYPVDKPLQSSLGEGRGECISILSRLVGNYSETVQSPRESGEQRGFKGPEPLGGRSPGRPRAKPLLLGKRGKEGRGRRTVCSFLALTGGCHSGQSSACSCALGGRPRGVSGPLSHPAKLC